MEISINGKNYASLVVEIKRKGSIIYSSNTGDVLAGDTILDPLGTKIGYTITIDSMYKDQQLLQDFWEDIIKPRKEGFLFKAPYNQGYIEFRAYAETAEQSLIQVYKGKNLWDKISIEIKPIAFQNSEVV